MKKIKAYLLRQIRMILLQQKVFTGRYADIMIAAQHWANERNILVQHYVIRDKKVANTVDETLSDDMKAAIRKQQEKEVRSSKDLMKGKKMIVWYGQDTQLHRWLGYKETWYHVMLKG